MRIGILIVVITLGIFCNAHSMFSTKNRHQKEEEKRMRAEERKLVASLYHNDPQNTNTNGAITEALEKHLKKMQKKQPDIFAMHLARAKKFAQ